MAAVLLTEKKWKYCLNVFIHVFKIFQLLKGIFERKLEEA